MPKKDWKNWGKVPYYNLESLIKISNIYKKLFKLYNINTLKMEVLEMGCGHGRFTLILNKMFKKIIAVDPEKILINMLNNKINEMKINNKNNKNEKIITINSDCSNLKFNKKFDMVIFSYSFMWINNKKKCLLNVNKLIKKNGYLLIIEPIKFMNILDKKFIKPRKLMIDTIKITIKSNKYDLIHFCNLQKSNIIYLLKKI